MTKVKRVSIREGLYSKWHPFWELDILDTQSSLRHDGSRNKRRTRYPVRSLRYWFMYHLIRKESIARRQPLDICEIGVGDGPMLAFLKADRLAQGRPLPQFLGRWDGVSRRVNHVHLKTLGYTHCLEKNIEDRDLVLSRQYDVLILLHILEHLYEPERTVERLLPFVKTGGVLIGGCPAVPHVMRHRRERQLRSRAEKFGHVSAFSTRRLKHLAERHHLTIEMLTGAYLFRLTGSFLENYRLWLRLNLLFGGLCPFWPGELYWAMRKSESR